MTSSGGVEKGSSVHPALNHMGYQVEVPELARSCYSPSSALKRPSYPLIVPHSPVQVTGGYKYINQKIVYSRPLDHATNGDMDNGGSKAGARCFKRDSSYRTPERYPINPHPLQYIRKSHS